MFLNFVLFTAGFELVNIETARPHQAYIMGIFHLVYGLGEYLGIAVLEIVNAISGAGDESNKWYPDEDNINNGKLANYFFLLAGLMFLNFVLYIFVARFFKAFRIASPRRNVRDRENLRSSSTSRNRNVNGQNYNGWDFHAH